MEGPGSTGTAPSTTTTTKSMSVFVWSPSENSTGMNFPLTVKIAVGFIAFAFLFIIIAFSTPAWLETDWEHPDPKFIRIGLWEGCFEKLPDANHNYDIRISGCWYLLSEELYHLNDLIFKHPNDQYLNRFFTGCRWIFDPFTTGYQEIRSFLVPAFFVAVQFFFTMCFIFLLISIVLVPMYILCFGPDHQYFVLLVRLIGIVLMASALLGSIAVIVFGAMGDSRAWMPDWQNNYLSWSFAFAVIGVFGEYVAGILFLVEARIQGKQRKLRESHSAYTMETKA